MKNIRLTKDQYHRIKNDLLVQPYLTNNFVAAKRNVSRETVRRIRKSIDFEDYRESRRVKPVRPFKVYPTYHRSFPSKIIAICPLGIDSNFLTLSDDGTIDHRSCHDGSINWSLKS